MTAEDWRALSEELDRALELQESERQAWLADVACRMAASILSQAEQEAMDRGSSAWIGEALLLRARTLAASAPIARPHG